MGFLSSKRAMLSSIPSKLHVFVVLGLLSAVGLTACPSCLGEDRGEITQSLTLGFWSNQQRLGPVDERLEAPWAWGFQGGSMVRPELVFHENVEVYDSEEFDVIIRNEVLPDSEDPDAFDPAFQEYRMRGTVFIDEHSGRAVLGPFDNQLGWDSLEGLHMKFSIEVIGFSGRLVHEVRLVDILSREAEKCAAYLPATLATSETACLYARLPGSVRVTNIETDDFSETCAGNNALVYGAFVPDAPETSACLEAYIAAGWPDPTTDSFPVELNVNATQACLSENGLRENAEGAAQYLMGVSGNCNPLVTLTWSEDLSICGCQ